MKSKTLAVITCGVMATALCHGQGGFPGFGARNEAPPSWIEEGYNDHQYMMDLLGIKTLRPGKDGGSQTGPGFDEATANDWMPTIPNALIMKDGTKVTTPEQWEKRRAEIVEDFESEVYGRIPDNVPGVTWEITETSEGSVGDFKTITKTLVGHVDNSAFPQITVDIQASITVPADATSAVPIFLQFGGGFGGFGGGGGNGAVNTNGVPYQALSHGWGYGTINPGSIQGDRGGNALRQGIIGLTNKGEPRKPDDWGALRAWGWGVSRLIDFFEATPELKADPSKVSIEGVSRYGKAALVTQAFEPRVAVALVASSGEGGAKLHRHDYGEAVENLTADGEYHWMAGNFLKYGAADINGKSMDASDLPVDSHELIALCAPRPCFISYGVPPGDPAWVDAPGSYRAGILASKVYKVLGKVGYGYDVIDWVHEPLPPVGTLKGGDLAFRQHEGGHTSAPNIPPFFEWVGDYIQPSKAAAQTTETPAADASIPEGETMFYASHSLMWDVPPPLEEIVKAYGIKGHTLAIQRMGFSRTSQFWDQAEAQSQAKQALQAGKTDVFVMSPMDMPDVGVEGFVMMGVLQNPDMRFFVQNNWAGFNNDGQKARESMMMMGQLKKWDETTEEDLKTLNTTCEKAFEDQVKEINEKLGRQALFIIPTSQANSELRARIIRGEFPGLTKQSQLFLDQIGHPTPPLVALNAYLHFATIYGRSPVGLPMPSILKNADHPEWNEEMNKALQELAWKTVINYPLSGVKAP
ncbi:MAG: hypothetical protein JXR40_08825 [Pontiellaceae bacterium]|nr:hypothetical protein [Pontiellaceae bacterium]